MSYFECRNGHEIVPSEGSTCKICGERVYKMDGLTGSQLRKMEMDWDREVEDREETEESEEEGDDDE